MTETKPIQSLAEVRTRIAAIVREQINADSNDQWHSKCCAVCYGYSNGSKAKHRPDCPIGKLDALGQQIAEPDQQQVTDEHLLSDWRHWAQFVFLDGGPVTLPDWALREAVCKKVDADVAEARGAGQQIAQEKAPDYQQPELKPQSRWQDKNLAAKRIVVIQGVYGGKVGYRNGATGRLGYSSIRRFRSAFMPAVKEGSDTP